MAGILFGELIVVSWAALAGLERALVFVEEAIYVELRMEFSISE